MFNIFPNAFYLNITQAPVNMILTTIAFHTANNCLARFAWRQTPHYSFIKVTYANTNAPGRKFTGYPDYYVDLKGQGLKLLLIRWLFTNGSPGGYL
jgi:hypothetical protein